MRGLAIFIALAVLGTFVFQHAKKGTAPPVSFKDASVKARQGLLAAGRGQVLAINAHDQIYGYGLNSSHELGLIGIDIAPVPKLVSDQRDWRYVHAGSNVSLALDQYGKLWRRLYLGNDRNDASDLASLGKQIQYLPVDMALHFRKAMEHSGLAVTLDESQKLWVWRESMESFASQFLDRLAEPAPDRIEVQPMKKWRDFCISESALSAIDEQGALWQLSGQDLKNARKHSSTPLSDVTLSKINSIAPPAERVYCSGDWDTVMLQDSKGELWGYGSNKYGELGMGDGSVDLRKSHPVSAITHLAPGNYSEVVVAPGFTLAIHRDGSLWAWGLNTSGQLGIGKEISGSDKPHLVDRTRIWIAIAAGHSFAAGMTSQGELLSWGTGTLGDGGTTPMRDRPLPVFDSQKWGGAAQ